MTQESAVASPRPFRCMEIRGGSGAVEERATAPGLDLFVVSRPFAGAALGGDVHYVSTCGGGVISRLIVADVSGHGASVADFAGSLRGLMRRNINAKSQTRLVRDLNRQFGELAGLGRFATAVVATYLADKRRLTVCNAGHPRPIWRPAAEGTWRPLEAPAAGNLPLGVDDAGEYRQLSVEMAEGDLVAFYTDALTEAADAAGHLLGEAGLIRMAGAATASAADDPKAVADVLLAAVDGHRQGRPPDDDTTLVVLRQNGEGPRRLSLADKFEAYAKVFGLRAV